MRLLTPFLCCAVVVACSGEPPPQPIHAGEAEARRSSSAAPASAVSPPEAEPEEPPETEVEGPCGESLRCCRAFVAAIPHVVESSACAGVMEAVASERAERRCRALTAGWALALGYTPDGAPVDCGAPTLSGSPSPSPVE